MEVEAGTSQMIKHLNEHLNMHRTVGYNQNAWNGIGTSWQDQHAGLKGVWLCCVMMTQNLRGTLA